MLGSNPDLENSPSAIQQAIKKGFDCEIDLWVKDKKFLGHDYPQYEIDIDFLLDINQFIWIHCKNLSAINYLTEKSDIFNFFGMKMINLHLPVKVLYGHTQTMNMTKIL